MARQVLTLSMVVFDVKFLFQQITTPFFIYHQFVHKILKCIFICLLQIIHFIISSIMFKTVYLVHAVEKKDACKENSC